MEEQSACVEKRSESMSFIYTEEQKGLKEMVRNFMEKEVRPVMAQYDQSGEFPQDLYKKAFDMGLHCLQIPEEFGGAGLDNQTMAILLEEMGRVDPGFAITILSTAHTLNDILDRGNEDQKKRAADIIIPGGHASFVMTEPDAGSDPAGLATKAERDGDMWVLNGTKCFATNGEYADLYFLVATVDKTLGSKGTVAFMIEKGTPGLTVGAHEDKMGLRLSNTATLYLDNCRVPDKNRIGEIGDGLKIALYGLDVGRIYNAAISVGIAQHALEEAASYAKVREQFGKPIIKNQMMQQILADMQIGTEAARCLVMNSMKLVDEGIKDVRMEASICKTFASDNAVKCACDAIQVLGGYGFSKEYAVEKIYRDSKIFQIFEGTNQIQRIVIAKEVEKKY